MLIAENVEALSKLWMCLLSIYIAILAVLVYLVALCGHSESPSNVTQQVVVHYNITYSKLIVYKINMP